MNRKSIISLRHYISVVVLSFIASGFMPCWATSPPTIAPVNVASSQPGLVQISMTAPAGSIYYTLDGSQPSVNSTFYGGVFYPGNGITQVNAIAINSGVSSTVTSAYYVLNGVYYNVPSPSNWYLDSFGPVVTGKIADWPDLSGHSADATQATSTKQPSLIANGNFGTAINFNGTSTDLQLPSQTFTNSGMTMFVVVNPTTTVANTQILNFSAATAPQNLIGLSENASKAAQFTIYNAAGTSSTVVAAPTAMTANVYQLIEVVQGDVSPTTSTLYVNGVQVAQNTAMNMVPAATLTNNFIGQYSGGSQFFKGNIAEVMLYTSPLTTSNRAIVESYLLGKYQIAMQTPTAPVFSTPTSTLTGPAQVAIAAQPNATIRYTLDGTTPNATTSPIYAKPLRISFTQTLKSIAVYNGISSGVTTATYTLNATQYPAPSASGPALKINVTVPAIGIP